jgi:DNA polymerase III gamma/tau subunit
VTFLSLGQETAKSIARRSAAAGQLQRTLLVHGPVGAGKSAFVDDLLALLFCTEQPLAARPCNACRGCREARARSHPDLLVGSPERWREDRSTGESIVAVARRWLLETAGAPIAGERRVALVEGADRANEQTQNVLLKALEEPGGRQMFILVAADPSRLLPTIRSRCQVLRVGTVPRAELAAWLTSRERVPADDADALARLAGGLAGTAIGFAREPSQVEWLRRTQRELLALVERGPADRFSSVRDLLDEAARRGGAQPAEVEDGTEAEAASRTPAAAQRQGALLIVDAWLGLARDLLVAAAGRPEMAPSAALLPETAEIARRLAPGQLRGFVALLERVRDGLQQNAAPRLALEVAMLSWPRIAA